MRWAFRSFAELDTHELLAIMKLRVDVFVVEQACAYAEIDHHDNAPETIHLLGWDNQSEKTLAAYCRAMPNSQKQEVRIGRVVVNPAHRRRGIAKEMMLELFSSLRTLDYDLALSAQTTVVEFYNSLGFVIESAEYVEDGIPHVDMRRPRELP